MTTKLPKIHTPQKKNLGITRPSWNGWILDGTWLWHTDIAVEEEFNLIEQDNLSKNIGHHNSYFQFTLLGFRRFIERVDPRSQ